MGLLKRSADNPAFPGSATPQGAGTNQYLPEAAVARMLLSRWVNKASLIDICDKRLSSQFTGDGAPIGDQITVPIRDRHGVTEGVDFSAQPRLARWVTLSFRQPRGIHSEDSMWNGIFRDEKIEKERYQDKIDRFVSDVEETIGDEMRQGYWYGIQATHGSAATLRLAAAGEDSDNYPRGRVLHRTEAAMSMRGINRGMPCAMLDPETHASLMEAIEDAPHNPGSMSRQSYGRGSIEGSGKFGWELKKSVHNGVVDYDGIARTVVRTAPANDADSVALNFTTGKQLKADGLKLQFKGVRGVNEETSKNVQRRASFTLTSTAADRTTPKSASGTATLGVAPNVRFSTATLTDTRQKTVSAQPAANATVFFNGLDSSVATNVTAMADKKALASFLVARNSTYLIMQDPDIPPDGRDNVQAIRVRNGGYGVNFWYLKYFRGDNVTFRDRIDGRWVPHVMEGEAGYVLGGVEEEA